MKGVVLIAAGHFYYGQWAQNLCLSIKYNDMFLPVSLAWKGRGLETINTKFFDKVIELTDEQTHRNGVEDFLKPKTCLWDITPYEETIFIDADVILFQNKPLSELLKTLDCDFTIGCRNEDNLEEGKELQWATNEEIIEKYGSGTLYHLSSEFIYFRKSKTKEFFELVKKIYNDPEITYKRFNGGIADELAFQLAMKVMDMKPHKVPFLPFYWEHFEKKNARVSQIKDYYGYSMGGVMNRDESVQIYNGLAHFYANQYKAHPFLAKHKRSFLPMRQNL